MCVSNLSATRWPNGLLRQHGEVGGGGVLRKLQLCGSRLPEIGGRSLGELAPSGGSGEEVSKATWQDREKWGPPKRQENQRLSPRRVLRAGEEALGSRLGVGKGGQRPLGGTGQDGRR